MGGFDRDACVAYVLSKTREVVAFGQRPPGSPAEMQAQQVVKAELEACCDGPVALEEFQVAQKAFMGMQRVCAVLLLLAAVGYWVSPWCAAPLSLVALVVIVQQLVRYKLLLDPYFPKKPSSNVDGRVAPSGE